MGAGTVVGLDDESDGGAERAARRKPTPPLPLPPPPRPLRPPTSLASAKPPLAIDATEKVPRALPSIFFLNAFKNEVTLS